MRRAKSRLRKITVTPELVEAFRRGVRAEIVLVGKPTRVQYDAARALVHAFDVAAGTPLWERFSPLSPQASGEMKAMQDELVARLPEDEAKAWRAYCRRYWKRHDADMAAERKATPRAETAPRSEPDLKCGGHW